MLTLPYAEADKNSSRNCDDGGQGEPPMSAFRNSGSNGYESHTHASAGVRKTHESYKLLTN
jgi:hypothetical protein